MREAAYKEEVTMVEAIGTTAPLPGMITDQNQNASLLALGHEQPIPDESLLKGNGSEQKLPNVLDCHPSTHDIEDLSHTNCRCCRRIFRQVVYQELLGSNLPLIAFRRLPQSACAGCCAVLFVLLGVLLLVSAGGVKELEVGYSHTDANKAFTVSTSMEGPVLVWYDLPNMRLNRKRVVSSKDKSIWGYPTSPYQCDDADTLQEIDWRRSNANFSAMFSAPGADKFRPCGLVAIALFTDTFGVYTDGGNAVPVDATDIALSTDKRLYEENNDFVSVSGQSYDFTLHGTPSWLTAAWLDRFKVWSRTPASPHVRQLYGRIQNGLPAGQYWLNFTVNDPIFEVRWDVSKKLIIFSESHTLGSKGALSTLGIFCIVIAVFEVLFGIALLVAPVLTVASVYTTAPPPGY